MISNFPIPCVPFSMLRWGWWFTMVLMESKWNGDDVGAVGRKLMRFDISKFQQIVDRTRHKKYSGKYLQTVRWKAWKKNRAVYRQDKQSPDDNSAMIYFHTKVPQWDFNFKRRQKFFTLGVIVTTRRSLSELIELDKLMNINFHGCEKYRQQFVKILLHVLWTFAANLIEINWVSVHETRLGRERKKFHSFTADLRKHRSSLHEINCLNDWRCLPVRSNSIKTS